MIVMFNSNANMIFRHLKFKKNYYVDLNVPLNCKLSMLRIFCDISDYIMPK